MSIEVISFGRCLVLLFVIVQLCLVQCQEYDADIDEIANEGLNDYSNDYANGYVNDYVGDNGPSGGDVIDDGNNGETVGELLTPFLSKVFGEGTTINDFKNETLQNSPKGKLLGSFLANVIGEGANIVNVANVTVDATTKAAIGSFMESLTENGLNIGTPNETNPDPTTQRHLPATTWTMTWPSDTSSTTPLKTSDQQSAEARCYEDALFANFCAVPDDLFDLDFWDLYYAIFSDSVLDELVLSCSTGTWCLQDRFDFWNAEIAERVDIIMNSEIAAGMCKPEMTSCFETMEEFYDGCPVFPQLQFTTEAIELLCQLRASPGLTEECTKQTIVSLHVTVADVIRSTETITQESETSSECNSAGVHMTERLMCMENSCPGDDVAFREFPPWMWFTQVVDDVINECGLDSTKCVDVLQVGETSTPTYVTSAMTSRESSSLSSTFLYSSLTGSTRLTSSTSASMSAEHQQHKPLAEELYTEELELMVGGSIAASVITVIMAKLPLAEELYTQELGLMVGGSIAVSVIAVVTALLACALYRRYRRNAVVKEGYQKLLSDPDES